jgi:hypothetical protein
LLGCFTVLPHLAIVVSRPGVSSPLEVVAGILAAAMFFIGRRRVRTAAS